MGLTLKNQLSPTKTKKSIKTVKFQLKKKHPKLSLLIGNYLDIEMMITNQKMAQSHKSQKKSNNS